MPRSGQSRRQSRWRHVWHLGAINSGVEAKGEKFITSKTPFVVGDNIDPDCVQVPLQISRFGTDANRSHSSLWLLRTTRNGHNKHNEWIRE